MPVKHSRKLYATVYRIIYSSSYDDFFSVVSFAYGLRSYDVYAFYHLAIELTSLRVIWAAYLPAGRAIYIMIPYLRHASHPLPNGAILLKT